MSHSQGDAGREVAPIDAHDEPVEINPLVHLIAPLAAVVGTMVVRKVVNSAYERATGHPAPMPRDPATSWTRAIVWTAVITTTAAVAEVAIYRAVNRMGSHPQA
jgi:anti-sigma-K factor RskA